MILGKKCLFAIFWGWAMTSYASSTARAEMSELRRLRSLLPPELQSWVTVEATTAVNPPLITCEEVGKDGDQVEKDQHVQPDQRHAVMLEAPPD